MDISKRTADAVGTYTVIISFHEGKVCNVEMAPAILAPVINPFNGRKYIAGLTYEQASDLYRIIRDDIV